MVPGRLDQVAWEEKAEGVEAWERRQKVEVQWLDLRHWEHPGVAAQVVGVEVLLQLPSPVLAVELQL